MILRTCNLLFPVNLTKQLRLHFFLTLANLDIFNLRFSRKLPQDPAYPVWCSLWHNAFSGIACFETSFWSEVQSFPGPWPVACARRVSDTVGGKISCPDIGVDAGWNGCDFVVSVWKCLLSSTSLSWFLLQPVRSCFHLKTNTRIGVTYNKCQVWTRSKTIELIKKCIRYSWYLIHTEAITRPLIFSIVHFSI